MSLEQLLGLPVITSPMLPLAPSPAQDARRIVRHGLADVLEWLGEKPGPRPGEETHVLIVGNTIHASAAWIGAFR